MRLPNLDDRRFEQLLAEAQRRIARSCPGWTDFSPGDPGTALLEAFAYLTEIMLYRLNRLPEKAYIEFLRLMGLRLQPPVAAAVQLRFTRSQAAGPLVIPRGARVTVARASGGDTPPVFVTAHDARFPPDALEAWALAHHGELIEGELAGSGSGAPGLVVKAGRPPIIAPTGVERDLVVGVELGPGEEAPAIRFQGKDYRIWREVENFTDSGPDGFVYIADRVSGVISFAPALRLREADGQLETLPRALAEIPPAGREIRLWYRRGGGPEGNLAAGTLTVLKDPIPGVQVTNPEPASGGREAETLDNALLRGPQELRSLQRAVTAFDFERLALRRSGAVVRARALTQAAVWRHAVPGTVEVLLVPAVPDADREGYRIAMTQLQQQCSEPARRQVQNALDERRPLGTACLVSWARFKTVRVMARIVVRREEDPGAVRERVLQRLYRTISPLPAPPDTTGWDFGRALRAYDIYDIVSNEPGIDYVDRVRLIVDEAPEGQIRSVAADAFQPDTWYAASADKLFRSMNNGEGWEAVGQFAGEEARLVRVHPYRPGLLAVATRCEDRPDQFCLHLSEDCGETWSQAVEVAFRIRDMAWSQRQNLPRLLLATDAGLYELALGGATPLPVVVDAAEPALGFYAIAVASGVRGERYVALAAQKVRGIFLSGEGGAPETFRAIGLRGEDIRVLSVHQEGQQTFLWAGLTVPGNESGSGCWRRELIGTEEVPEGWVAFSKGWQGGSCRALAWAGPLLMAATHRAGVLRLDPRNPDAGWMAPDIRCGLPLRDRSRLNPVDALAARNDRVFAGGPEGLYRSQDAGLSYVYRSQREFPERVTLPDTWLFCSGEHAIAVVDRDEADRD